MRYLLSVLLLMGLLSAQEEEGVELLSRFQKGDRLTIRAGETIRLTQKIENFSGTGDSLETESEEQNEDRTLHEILEVDEILLPLREQRTIEREATTIRISGRMGEETFEEGPETETGLFEGAVLEIARKGEGTDVTIVEQREEIPEEALRDLQIVARDAGLLLPGKRVKPGDEWTLRGDLLRSFWVGERPDEELTAIEGTLTLRLKRVHTVEGHAIADVEYTGEIRFTLEETREEEGEEGDEPMKIVTRGRMTFRDIQGAYEFDLDQGCFRRLHFQARIEGRISDRVGDEESIEVTTGRAEQTEEWKLERPEPR